MLHSRHETPGVIPIRRGIARAPWLPHSRYLLKSMSKKPVLKKSANPKAVDPKQLIAQLRRFCDRKEYAALKKSAQAAVVDWRWATDVMIPTVPHEDVISEA